MRILIVLTLLFAANSYASLGLPHLSSSSELRQLSILKSIQSEKSFTGQTSISGVLKFGHMAIGAETTGVVIESEFGNIEVMFSNKSMNGYLHLDNKRVELYGEFISKMSIERSVRTIFIASDFLELE